MFKSLYNAVTSATNTCSSLARGIYTITTDHQYTKDLYQNVTYGYELLQPLWNLKIRDADELSKIIQHNPFAKSIKLGNAYDISILKILGYEALNTLHPDTSPLKELRTKQLHNHWINYISHFEMCLKLLLQPNTVTMNSNYSHSQRQAHTYMRDKSYTLGSIASIWELLSRHSISEHNQNSVALLPLIYDMIAAEAPTHDFPTRTIEWQLQTILRSLGQNEDNIASSSEHILKWIPHELFTLRFNPTSMPMIFSFMHFLVDYQKNSPKIHRSLLESPDLTVWLDTYIPEEESPSDSTPLKISEENWQNISTLMNALSSYESFNFKEYIKLELSKQEMDQRSIQVIFEICGHMKNLQPHVVLNSIHELSEINPNKNPISTTLHAVQSLIPETLITTYRQMYFSVMWLENYPKTLNKIQLFVSIFSVTLFIALSLLMPCMYFCLHAYTFTWGKLAYMSTVGMLSGGASALLVLACAYVCNALYSSSQDSVQVPYQPTFNPASSQSLELKVPMPATFSITEEANISSNVIAIQPEIKGSHGTAGFIT